MQITEKEKKHHTMKISYNWLKEYLKTDLTPNELSIILTDIGLEVEGIEEFESVKGGLKGLVIGKVLTCIKHPDADKLSITTVNVGNNTILPIVCGAPNVAAEQTVVVATVGTVLYSGDESFTIKKSKIRGEASEGMICAEDEIGMGASHDGILVIDQDITPGTPAADYFKIDNDLVFEIGLTPNRVDAASHFGVARDLAAYIQQTKDIKAVKASVENFKTDNNNLKIDIDVKNSEICPRYAGVTVSNIEVKESPDWLKNRLKAIGLSSINNIVDITNYVLHETGQPLHAFDAAKIAGNKIVVQTVADKTKFITLDESERELSENDLMICNTQEPMCIAGVFGGLHSGVSNKTKNIFIESAYFNPVSVRKTAKRHGLNTDSSFRFERGIDPNNTIYALKRAALLVKELAGGEISSDIIDIYPNPIANFTVEVKYSNITRLIGEEIQKETISNILKGLEIEITSKDENGLTLSVPPYRVDVTREADVIEEILRIYGYNNIAIPTSVHSTLQNSVKPDIEAVNNLVADYLSSNGFNEIMCNSLTKQTYYQDSKVFDVEQSVKILNPLSQDLNAMRQNLVFGVLESAIHNINRRNGDLKLFEFGKHYSFDSTKEALKKYSEELHLALFITGKRETANWNTPAIDASFYLIKTYAENILTRLGFDLEKINTDYFSNEIYSEGLKYILNGKTVIELGILNRKTLKKLDIKQEAFFADLNWEAILKASKKNNVAFKELPKFPEVKRDLALLIDENVKFTDLKKSALKTEKSLLKKVDLFDIYQGKGIEEGKKSYALSFIIQDDEKTLTDKQIDKIMQKITFTLEKEFGAKLR